MFLPFFIAILIGLATPADTNYHKTHNTNNNGSIDPDDPNDNPIWYDTGGETGHNPIKH